MRVLLDTCALLWLVGEPARLSAKARTALEDVETELCVSAISAFDVALKHKKGKLSLPLLPRDWLREAFAAYAIRELVVTAEIGALAPVVDVPHGDPCDRIIIASAQVHRLPVVTSDHLIAGCAGVAVVW